MPENLEAKIAALEKRLAGIEARLPQRIQPAEGGEPVIIESGRLETLEDMRDRIQELEDLLLLMELENTKIRESVGISQPVPDISDRLGRIEEQLAIRQDSGVEQKMRSLESKLEPVAELHEKMEEVHETVKGKASHAHVNERIAELKHDHEQQIARLHQRIDDLEKAPKAVTRIEKVTPKPKGEEKSILEEVQMILKNK